MLFPFRVWLRSVHRYHCCSRIHYPAKTIFTFSTKPSPGPAIYLARMNELSTHKTQSEMEQGENEAEEVKVDNETPESQGTLALSALALCATINQIEYADKLLIISSPNVSPRSAYSERMIVFVCAEY